MFCVVYSAPALGPAMFDPEVGMNFAAMVHGGQEFEWGEPACSGDEITTTAKCLEIYEKDGKGFYVFETNSVNQDGDQVVTRHLDQHRQGGLRWRELRRRRDQIAGAAGHPGQVPAAPLRGRLGRLQPDPHRPRVREGGRPAEHHPPRPLHDGPGRPRQRPRRPAATRGR